MTGGDIGFSCHGRDYLSHVPPRLTENPLRFTDLQQHVRLRPILGSIHLPEQTRLHVTNTTPPNMPLAEFYTIGLEVQAVQGRASEELNSLRSALQGRAYWRDHELECLVAQGGRAVIYNPGLRIDGYPTAFFGWFEAESRQAAGEVLEKAEAWAARRGLSQIIGPINGTTAANYRFRIDHFGADPLPGEPDNPAKYPEYLAQAGYSAHHGYSSYIGHPRPDVGTTTLAEGLSVRSLSQEEWAIRRLEGLALCQEIFRLNFAFPGLETGEWDAIHGYFQKHLCPVGSQIALDGERMIGFSLCVPCCVNGRNTLAVKTVGTHPDYRRSGIFNAMGDRIHAAVLENYDQVAGVLIRDENASAITTLFRMVPSETRRYALFSKNIKPAL